jgi:hypothetical protein
MHPHADVALRAARHWRRWGKFAAVRYCAKSGVSTRLLGLAVALEQERDGSAAFARRCRAIRLAIDADRAA